MKFCSGHPRRLALITVVIAFVLLATGGWVYLLHLKSNKQKLGNQMAQQFSQRLVQRTYETVSPVYMLAALVRDAKGNLSNFQNIAPDLLDGFPLARALELAPNGIVQEVFPLAGNEAIIGHDLLKDRTRNREAHLAVAKRQLTLAGPFELIQGGLGAVGRYPIFLPGERGREYFWGFAIVLIHVPDLLATGGELGIERQGFNYEICRVLLPVEGGGCKRFTASGEGEMDDPVTVMVNLPNNRWLLSVEPVKGWISTADWLSMFLVALLGALAAGLVHCYWLSRNSDEPLADPALPKSGASQV